MASNRKARRAKQKGRTWPAAAARPTDYTVAAAAHGNYALGPGGQYSLGPEALDHILLGDIGQRPIRTAQGFSHLQPFLKGGLHTVDGWLAFKKTLQGLKHGANVLAPEEPWYWARELQNGVILLRVPREMYQRNAAELTRYADAYYKSGYLWKTLFPRDTDIPEVLRLVNEALHNLDKEESGKGILIGYARVMDPMNAIKVRIQVTGTQINSAFPTWGQPMTGNNGKPYSHSDSIGYFTADSTEFFDDFDDYQKLFSQTRLFGVHKAMMEDLVRSTPAYLLGRPAYSRDQLDKDQRDAWKSHLEDIGAGLSAEDADALRLYLDDVVVRKVPFDLVRGIYSQHEMAQAPANWKNAADVYQNCADGLRVLCVYQVRSGPGCTVAWDFMRTWLRTRFLNTGGLDLWQAKRLHVQIIRWVIDQDSGELAWEYIKELAGSPNRIAFYTWFNLNPWAGFPLEIIGVTEPAVVISAEMFYSFVGDNLGLNYVTTRSAKERTELAGKLQKNYSDSAQQMVGDLVSAAESADFTPSPCLLEELLPLLEKAPHKADEESLRLVVVDHFRILLLAHYVIVNDNIDVIARGEPHTFDPLPTSAYGRYTKVKHLRQLLWLFHEQYLNALVKAAQALGMQKLGERAELMRPALRKERIPLPQQIPKYIPNWASGKNAPKRLSNKKFASVMLGAERDSEMDFG